MGLSFIEPFQLRNASYELVLFDKKRVYHRMLIVINGSVSFIEDDIGLVELYENEYFIEREGHSYDAYSLDKDSSVFVIEFDAVLSDAVNSLSLAGELPVGEGALFASDMESLKKEQYSYGKMSSRFYSFVASICEKCGNSELTAIAKTLSRVVLGEDYPKLLKELGYYKYVLKRGVQNACGKDHCYYMTEAKLVNAKKMYIDSRYHIRTIADICGFRDYIELYNAFMLIDGCTPSGWLMRYINKEYPDDKEFHLPQYYVKKYKNRR